VYQNTVQRDVGSPQSRKLRPTLLMALAVVWVLAILGAFFCASGLFGLDLDVLHSNLHDPTSKPSSKVSDDASTRPPPAAFDRLVFVVIDALRADMVLGNVAIGHHHEELNAFMPYVSRLASSHKESIAYIGHAAVPTGTGNTMHNREPCIQIYIYI
jgi:hypothetical protein